MTERQRFAYARRALRMRRRVWSYLTAHPSASLREISFALGLSKAPDAQPNGNVAVTVRFLRRAGMINYVDGSKRAHDIELGFYVGPLHIFTRKQ